MRTLFETLQSQRHVLRNFVARDLKVKYRATVLGYLWSLLEPLSLVLVYYFVFEVIARRGGTGYPLIVVLGVLPYNLMSTIILGGSSALTGNAALIRRVYIPREVFVLAMVGSNLVVFGLSMLVVIPFLLVYDVVPGWRVVFIPVAVASITLFATGIAFVVACANALFRDVTYVIQVALRLLFYGSPAIYTVSMVPERFHPIYLINPTAIYLSTLRCGVMNTPLPFSPIHVATASMVGLASFMIGYTLFRRWQAKAVKFL